MISLLILIVLTQRNNDRGPIRHARMPSNLRRDKSQSQLDPDRRLEELPVRVAFQTLTCLGIVSRHFGCSRARCYTGIGVQDIL